MQTLPTGMRRGRTQHGSLSFPEDPPSAHASPNAGERGCPRSLGRAVTTAATELATALADRALAPLALNGVDRPGLLAALERTHFLTRTLEKVRTEMSLHVLAYNMKRVIAILRVSRLIEAIRA
jgi:hypothetical protein